MRNIGKGEVDKVSSGQMQFWQSRKWNAIQREVSQMKGRSTQERIGNDRWCFTVREERQPCQVQEWQLHRCQHFIQLPIVKVPEVDSTYAIGQPKCHNDVVRARC